MEKKQLIRSLDDMDPEYILPFTDNTPLFSTDIHRMVLSIYAITEVGTLQYFLVTLI